MRAGSGTLGFSPRSGLLVAVWRVDPSGSEVEGHDIGEEVVAEAQGTTH